MNQEISKAIAEASRLERLNGVPQTLDEFNRYFARYDAKVSFDSRLANDYLSRFDFREIRSEKLAIWISLTPTSHAGQANQDHIEILMPIPEKLRSELFDAESGTVGFLMKNAANYVGTKPAHFTVGAH